VCAGDENEQRFDGWGQRDEVPRWIEAGGLVQVGSCHPVGGPDQHGATHYRTLAEQCAEEVPVAGSAVFVMSDAAVTTDTPAARTVT
jgi:hypothetical protein